MFIGIHMKVLLYMEFNKGSLFYVKFNIKWFFPMSLENVNYLEESRFKNKQICSLTTIKLKTFRKSKVYNSKYNFKKDN